MSQREWNRSPWGADYDYREAMLTCKCRRRSCGVCLIAKQMLRTLKTRTYNWATDRESRRGRRHESLR